MNSYILIDRSGSMMSNWGETIGAVNAYAEALAEDKNSKKVKMTVIVFDSTSIDIVREKVKVFDWNKISKDEFKPRGMTPLFDAVGFLGDIVNKKKRKRADIVIVTDGYENSSKEFDQKSAKKIIEEFKSNNYAVSFIGADFDALSTAKGFGVDSSSVLNMSSGNYKSAMRSRAVMASNYNNTGNVADTTFTKKQKDEALRSQLK